MYRVSEQEALTTHRRCPQLQTGITPSSRVCGSSTIILVLPQVPELPVYGVAIPTVSGMRLVLDELGAAQGNAPLQRPLLICCSVARGKCGGGGKGRGPQLHA